MPPGGHIHKANKSYWDLNDAFHKKKTSSGTAAGSECNKQTNSYNFFGFKKS